jgi:8-oxo-dGTP diphosphatase
MDHRQPDVLDVAAGVILNESGQILIAQRPDHLHQGGLWEFPGGKLEAVETPRQALDRELKEELDIQVERASPLMTLRHDYPDRCVRLHVWRVERFSGTPQGLQGQPMTWVSRSDLPGYEFPAANGPIVTAARLPDRYAIVDGPGEDGEDFLAKIEEHANRGIEMIRLRASRLRSADYLALAQQAASICRERGIALLVNGPASLAEATGADGLHLRSDELMALSRRPAGSTHWVAASCHDAAQIEHAGRIGVDFVMLGPVLPTATHPEVTPLGWGRFARLVEAARLPVFALGGLSESHMDEAKQAGAQGVAGIRGWL